METGPRIEQTLEDVMAGTVGPGGRRFWPGAALGGLSRRPPHPATLCLAVARACGDSEGLAATCGCRRDRALHCASLVHDDLPLFRRRRHETGQALGSRAVWNPDHRIGRRCSDRACLRNSGAGGRARTARFVDLNRRSAVGAPSGVAGQAWECEAAVPLATASAQKPARYLWAQPWPAPPRRPRS